MKVDSFAGYSGAHLELIALSETATRAIPPLWPLASSVAVNPFLGQADTDLAQTAALLGRVSGACVTMPRAWYAARIEDGTITDADLATALARVPHYPSASIADLKAAALAQGETVAPAATIAELAAKASGIDWPSLIDERIGAWAAGYFDQGQALWQATPGRAAFESWQVFASRDLTPEIAGLTGFAGSVAKTPERARSALALACDALSLDPSAAATYFHQLLMQLGGWAQLARQKLWQAELAGKTTAITTDLLTIRLVWERVLYEQYGPQIAAKWAATRAIHATPLAASTAQTANAVLQMAADCAAQRKLAQTLATKTTAAVETAGPALQAAFCIDVRSEVFRRALESLNQGVETLGFAGFFGLTAAHHGFASDVTELRLPVLLNPGFTSSSTSAATSAADQSARYAARSKRAWGRFKLAAVSSFAFVEATGPVYAGKLVRDALGLGATGQPNAQKPQFDATFSLPEKTAAAEKILRAMSLSDRFAPLVLLVGHGATVVNNAHASALQCGACGGYSGEVNARLLASLLNDTAVRDGLEKTGIHIPTHTRFIGALHDTTTDAVTLYDQDLDAPANQSALKSARDMLAAAGVIARTERALRLPRAQTGGDLAARSKDWSETRPEWALAGCSAFIAAPRHKTRGKSLQGRAFLHDYDWTKDQGFGILELILTAPVVVASWISLQYYGSVVAPSIFGAGNKLLHNVTGGIGVVEGNGGVLRTGLPWQSVHDGQKFMHDPVRLSVCIDAPQAAVTDILERHPSVRALFDNHWLHLFLLDSAGQMHSRYAGGLSWQACDPADVRVA